MSSHCRSLSIAEAGLEVLGGLRVGRMFLGAEAGWMRAQLQPGQGIRIVQEESGSRGRHQVKFSLHGRWTESDLRLYNAAWKLRREIFRRNLRELIERLHNSPHWEQKYLEGIWSIWSRLREKCQLCAHADSSSGVVGASEVSVVVGFWDSSSSSVICRPLVPSLSL